jgi:hypothetical protein
VDGGEAPQRHPLGGEPIGGTDDRRGGVGRSRVGDGVEGGDGILGLGGEDDDVAPGLGAPVDIGRPLERRDGEANLGVGVAQQQPAVAKGGAVGTAGDEGDVGAALVQPTADRSEAA